jgi:hypothetical protein
VTSRFLAPAEVPPAKPLKIENLKADDRFPVSVRCNVHAWMNAHLRIYDHPYFAVDVLAVSLLLDLSRRIAPICDMFETAIVFARLPISLLDVNASNGEPGDRSTVLARV